MQAQRLADDDPGGQRGEHSFHAENDGRMGGHGILLRDGLNGVAHADRQRATVKDRDRGVPDVAQADRFDEHRDAQADERTHRVLHQGESQWIEALGRRSQHHELHGDRGRAEQFQPVAKLKCQVLAAQVVETCRGAERSSHDAPSQPLSGDQRQNRHDDDVHRTDETRIGHFRVREPDLLGADRDGHYHAEHDARPPGPSLR